MKYEYSAGGVVYKKHKEKILILVGKHSYHHGWVFPKGLIGDRVDNRHQGKEETAIREVKEETGIDAEIEKELTPVYYFYSLEVNPSKSVHQDEDTQAKPANIKKTVYYFIMKAVGGDINVRDDEMEEVEWIDIDSVESRLTYESDKEAWIEAKQLISRV